ncbi:hypothetical protein CERSUDRAFT_97652 [Gelatoporia subvermispora B]|uniref:Uncharacterized protein n=1 Tax=Ceriporiopsis subvermispora (strain B) TaxID=914234 RepID=M2R7L2_CERS8|nr:hypothetical protein CERSUDRAFT_97652 [Gelatoporia subvermispora B]
MLRVSHVRLLRVHDFGVILIDGWLTIAKVLALYVKTNGKHGKHASVDDTQTIGAVSYLAVQVFEQFSTLNQFGAMTRATAKFQTFQYALIPSTAFLAVLTGAPKVQVSSITLEDTDWCLYKSLRDQETLFAETIKLFRQRGGPADDLI